MRLQLALDVSDIDDAVDFYTRLFGAEPAKRQPGYANFAIENPPSNWRSSRTQTMPADSTTSGGDRDVGPSRGRRSTDGRCRPRSNRRERHRLLLRGQTETWVVGPDAEQWEWYIKTSDEPVFGTDTIAPFTSKSVESGDDERACCP